MDDIDGSRAGERRYVFLRDVDDPNVLISRARKESRPRTQNCRRSPQYPAPHPMFGFIQNASLRYHTNVIAAFSQTVLEQFAVMRHAAWGRGLLRKIDQNLHGFSVFNPWIALSSFVPPQNDDENGRAVLAGQVDLITMASSHAS